MNQWTFQGVVRMSSISPVDMWEFLNGGCLFSLPSVTDVPGSGGSTEPLVLPVMTMPPTSGVANAVLLWSEDDGTGRIRLMVRYVTGAAHVLDIQDATVATSGNILLEDGTNLLNDDGTNIRVE